MTFADSALRLSALAAHWLHWRPDDFWTATPAELAAILLPPGETHAPPDLDDLMERFPDG
ncbi:phage tail assembly chaperone [Novosphingopyxis iocasae]|uniref:phage tail assembly chaperone n=1 Tax=Novosphingopyxis iocasae TaxID=2762729 RepID=UPI0016514CAA|nr:phage tail assembly chaperone [Novosphingopyxis iocasae]